jgi:DNA invertase Pin-like site-specific DNA recombinase
MSTAWSYGRVSGYAQARDGYSLEVQRDKAIAYYDYRLKPAGFAWGGFFHDPAVSGSTRLADRPDGRKLAGAVERGDAVIVAKLDRAFRNAADLLVTMAAWSARGVGFHFLDINLDTTTDVGRLVVQILGAFAQFERARIAERIMSSKALKCARGYWPHPSAPWGFRKKKVKGGYVLADCPEERAVGAECLHRSEAGETFVAIALDFIRHNVRHPRGKSWHPKAIARYARAERALRFGSGAQGR